MAVERANVCLLMIDASTGITEQDEKIAGIAHEAGKAVIIVVNKWDLIEKDNSTVNEFNTRIRTALAYMPYAPILYVSAQTGQRRISVIYFSFAPLFFSLGILYHEHSCLIKP